MESNLRVLVAAKEQRERRKIGIRAIADESGASRSTVERLLDNSIKRVPLDDLGAICRWIPAAPGDVLLMVEREEGDETNRVPTSITIASSFGRGYDRKITLEVGKEYIVSPLNPAKLRHRGRRCVLLAFTRVEEGKPDLIAQVRFLGTNRLGRVELDDLDQV